MSIDRELISSSLRSFPVPLGSIPQLPAWSCGEIKSSEGVHMVSGSYWLHSSVTPGEVSLVHCDVNAIDGEWCRGGGGGGEDGGVRREKVWREPKTTFYKLRAPMKYTLLRNIGVKYNTLDDYVRPIVRKLKIQTICFGFFSKGALYIILNVH